MTGKPPPVYLSVVVPFYNEEDVCGLFHEQLTKTLQSIDKVCEAIYINDGSTDRKGFVPILGFVQE